MYIAVFFSQRQRCGTLKHACCFLWERVLYKHIRSFLKRLMFFCDSSGSFRVFLCSTQFRNSSHKKVKLLRSWGKKRSLKWPNKSVYTYIPGTPRPAIYKWLFQLDDSQSLHRKWLEITKHPFLNGCLGFQVYIYILYQQRWFFWGGHVVDLVVSE